MATDPAVTLGPQITEAWAELQAARREWAHSPNSDTIRTEEYAEMRINRLLERLAGTMTAEQREQAATRATRTRQPA